MFFRFGSKTAQAVPRAGQAFRDIQGRLRQQQQCWARQLAQGPASFASLEQEVHRCFSQLVASLLADTAGQPAPKPEVAAQNGFSDQSQFSHHFKRLVGVTPGQFRKPARIA
jgi:AraC-like DNA-binding protein